MTRLLKKLLALSVISILLLGSLTFGMFFFLTHVPWVDLSILEQNSGGSPSLVIDDEGKEWARFELDHKKPIPLSSMPDHLIKAFLAAEDHDFFSHSGISIRGIVRSVMINILRRSRVQGASTITQQLVRLLYFEQKKTFSRKIKEQILSLAVERQFSKEQIIETYMNNIYFGCGIYGVEAASLRFWGKQAAHVTIDEAATLAAIIRSPSRNCPLINPENTRVRRNYVIRSMCKLGYVSQAQCETLLKKPIVIKTDPSHCIAPHIREYVRLFAENLVGRKELYTGGLLIKTSLNSGMQRTAQTVFKKHIDELKTKFGHDVDGSLISLDVSTGRVKALIGGYDFTQSQFNRALSAKRQIGSIFKPLVYATYIEQGHEFNELEIDEPITLEDHGTSWSPQNFNKKFEGPMTLAHALAVSKNTIAIKTLLKAGIPNVVASAERFHLTHKPDPYPSLALGCTDATALEVVGMFNVYANKGIYCQPQIIEWIKNSSTKKIFSIKQTREPVIRWSTASKMVQALSISFERFKAKNPSLWPSNVPVFGKTGTTNQSRTCWYAGSTPAYTTLIYIGRDNNQSLGKDVYPAQTALPLWLEFNKLIAQPLNKFDFDPALNTQFINPFSGMNSEQQSADSITILSS